jgi:hypothetical protein
VLALSLQDVFKNNLTEKLRLLTAGQLDVLDFLVDVALFVGQEGVDVTVPADQRFLLEPSEARRLAPQQFGDAIEFAGEMQASEWGVHHQVQAFSGEVIDQRQNTEALTAHQRIGWEVERPAQLAPLRDRNRCPGAQEPSCCTQWATAPCACAPRAPASPCWLDG